LEKSVHSLRRKQQASDDNRQLKLQKQAAKNLEITKTSSCCRRILPPTKQAQFSSFLPSFLTSFLSVSKIQPNTQADEDQKIQNTTLFQNRHTKHNLKTDNPKTEDRQTDRQTDNPAVGGGGKREGQETR